LVPSLVSLQAFLLSVPVVEAVEVCVLLQKRLLERLKVDEGMWSGGYFHRHLKSRFEVV
jgi:hypothetical protein